MKKETEEMEATVEEHAEEVTEQETSEETTDDSTDENARQVNSITQLTCQMLKKLNMLKSRMSKRKSWYRMSMLER